MGRCRRDLSALVTPELASVVTQWMSERTKWQAPKTTAKIFTENMNELVDLVRQEVAMLNCGRHAFMLEMKAEEDLEQGPLDVVENEEDFGYTADELLAMERSILEEIPLPGTPKDEADRRKEWLKLPKISRAAIRRLHATFCHIPNTVLIEILKNARADERYIQAAKHFRCDDCAITTKLPKQTKKVSLPKPYEFNHTLGLDVNYLDDAEGNLFSC